MRGDRNQQARLLARGEFIVPLFRTKRRTYLAENIGSLDVHLTERDRRHIDEIAPPGMSPPGVAIRKR